MIYYEKYGDNTETILMFLHGTNFVHCFSKQCSYFARKCQAVVPHLPGFGRNCDVAFSVELAVSQVAELAKKFGRPVTLVGFSLGAQLCLPLLCRHEELFNGAVIISPWLIKEISDIEKLMKQYSDSEKAMRKGSASGVNAFAASLSRGEREEHKEFCQTVSMQSILASVDNGILLSDYPEFADIDKPLAAICGIKETTDIRKSVRALAHLNPRCSYDMWDGAGHNIPYKYAARLNAAIEDILGKIDG